MGEVDGPLRQKLNKMVYGKTATNILKALQTGGPIRESHMKLYMYSDAQMYDKETNATVNDKLKEIFNDTMARVDTAQRTRLSMEELQSGMYDKKDEELPELDEPVVAKEH
jgi:hypothetical protein